MIKTGFQLNRRWAALAAGALLIASTQLLMVNAASAADGDVTEYKLNNGLRVVVKEDHRSPTVAHMVWYKAGSMDEYNGTTGVAHVLEHMMFKGTPTIGTKDYKKDLEIINEQERVRDLMRKEERKMRDLWRRGEITDLRDPEQKTARWKKLHEDFKKLEAEQAKIIVKNEFDRIYTSNGGSSMNAYTSNDHTAYFITVPANKLELFMWMESGRILNPVFREFYTERKVVFEERRMRTESTPLGKFYESFNSLFLESHPYGWPVLGCPSAIPAVPMPTLRRWWRVASTLDRPESRAWLDASEQPS